MAATLANYPNRRNGLNVVRLILAILVIVSHAWPIGGFGAEPVLGPFTPGHFAVASFFAVSGWLITESRLVNDLPAYAWRRFVRIYPGFLIALVVVGFGLAPLGSAIAGTPYSIGDGFRYVLSNAAIYMREHAVGSSLPGSAFPAWNGSLWTLFYEVLCYGVVGLLVTAVGRKLVAPSVVALWIVTTVAAVAVPAFVLPGPAENLISLAPFFFAGSLLYVLRSRIGFTAPHVTLAAVWLAAVVALDASGAAAAVPIAYLALWVGRAVPLHGFARKNDVSYGMYIYAFPVQQIVALTGGASFGVAVYIVICVAATMPFAVASWFCVERPVLRTRTTFDRFSLAHEGLLMRHRSRIECPPGVSNQACTEKRSPRPYKTTVES